MLKNKGFYRGINFGGWLSQCDYSEDRLNNFITESDFAKVSEWGLDHIRIPVDYNIFENDDGSYKEDGFTRIDKAFEYCEKYGLNVVLDLHKTAGFSFDNYVENETGFFENEQLQERFYRLWEEFAKRYGKLSKRVAFELLNEVTDKEYIDIWNRISNECIKRIRVYAPDTLILVGSYYNNSAEAVPYLTKPFDENVIYNFHCYEPLKFTHQGAYWTDMINKDERFSFDESNITPDFFEKLFSPAIEAAKRNNTTLYCGEYGVINIVSPEDTIKWFRCINSVFEKHGISRCAWSYKEMDFGLSDNRLDEIRNELLKYL
ncbi:MAG: glycoside hydrolase family 5 protein [Oscillospiraceae bacterium]|nr:glycoside hydrolase family 5 protein [Oscillospiraceae bacterium]